MQEQLNGPSSNGAVGRKTVSTVALNHPGVRGGGASETLGGPDVTADNRPAMLMLSHCIPDALGDAAAARAWQLLSLASRTYRVHLACINSSNINLLQWRAIDNYAEALRIESPVMQARILSAGMRFFNAPLADRVKMHPAIMPAVSEWRSQHDFDAVLLTHPALLTAAMQVQARYNICDMGIPQSVLQLRASHRKMFAKRRRKQSRLYQHYENQASQWCDLLTVSRYDDRRRYRDGECKTILLPEAVDVLRLAPNANQTPKPNVEARLVLHTNWQHAACRHMYDWFKRMIWPGVKQAVPHATLNVSDPHNPLATVNQLGDASVVVSPQADSVTSNRPIMQAMAMARPVIAPIDSAKTLGARHGEHILVTRRDQDWVDHCVTALRSTPVRAQLSRGARNFIEARCPLEETGKPFVDALRQEAYSTQHLAAAA